MADLILVAAGSGKRMGANKNKLYLELAGVPIIYRCLERINAIDEIERIFPIIKAGEEQDLKDLLEKFGPIPKLQPPTLGGKERADSVRNGLKAVLAKPGSGVILVHDAARPFLNAALIQRLIQKTLALGAAVPVMPVVETTRQGMEGHTQVIDRNQLHLTQTPQVFLRKLAEEVFLQPAQAAKQLTDEGSFFEELGLPLGLVEGEKYNLKITRPEDLPWAHALLAAYPELKSRFDK